MANVLPMEKRIAGISALPEGSGIRQIERMTGINRNTIMNLFVKRHNTLRTTPAMAAGIERDFWTVGDLVKAAA